MSASGLIVVGVVILIIIGVVVGYHTKTGSGIDLHPSDGVDHAGGAAAPQSEGTGTIAGHDAGEHDPFDTHGTR